MTKKGKSRGLETMPDNMLSFQIIYNRNYLRKRFGKVSEIVVGKTLRTDILRRMLSGEKFEEAKMLLKERGLNWEKMTVVASDSRWLTLCQNGNKEKCIKMRAVLNDYNSYHVFLDIQILILNGGGRGE
jgi:serine protease inhibitor ecotin